MGMQGFYSRAERRRRAAQGHRAPLHAAVFSFFLLIALAGCSANSSWSSRSSQSSALPPPTPAVAGATSSTAESAAVPGYPQQSLVDFFKQDAASTPAQTLAPSAAGTQTTTESPEASSSPYPRQTIFSAFQSSGTEQAPNMPHPPTTYTPSAQPYVPPQGQPTYSAAAPQSAPRPSSTYTPSGQPYSPPGQPAARAPQGSAPQADTGDEQQVPGYPSQSISDIFR